MLLKGRFVEDRTLAEERVGKQACELPEKGPIEGMNSIVGCCRNQCVQRVRSYGEMKCCKPIAASG